MKKILLTVLSLFLFISIANASEPQMMWEKKWGNDSTKELFLSVSSYEKDYYYVGGLVTKRELRFTSDVTPISLFANENSSSKSTYLAQNGGNLYSGVIVKYDNNGTVQWEKSPENVLFVPYVKSTSDGGVLAIAIIEQTDNNGLDTKLIKYDKDGIVVWSKEFVIEGYFNYCGILSNNCDINTSTIDFTKDGNIIFMIGSSQRTIIKLDKDGETIWRKDLTPDQDTDSIQLYFSSILDNEDNVVLSGYNIVDGDTTEVYKTITKYDTDGKLVFNNKTQLKDDEQSLPVSIVSNAKGEYILLNMNYSTSEDDTTSGETTNVVFETYDKNGKLTNTKKLTSDDDNVFTNTMKLYIDNSGNYVVNYYYGSMFYTRRYNSDLKLINGVTPVNKKLFFGFDYDTNNDFVFVGGQETISRTPYDDDESLQDVVVDTAIIEKYLLDYAINKEVDGKGSVDVNLDNAKAGDIITIDTNPDRGYRVDKIIVTDSNGNTIEVKDGKFTMPASDVIVKVIFTNSLLVNPKTGGIDLAGTLILMILLGLAGYEYMKSKQMLSL